MQSLREYRKQHRICQSDFAKSVGVEQATISRLETGAARPSLDLAIQIETVTNGAVPVRCWSQQRETEVRE